MKVKRKILILITVSSIILIGISAAGQYFFFNEREASAFMKKVFG